MENKKKKAQENKGIKQMGAVAQYSDSTFFKRKDEEAKKFLKNHPIPSKFWE